MNRTKGFSFIFSLYITLSAFHIELFASKKENLMDETCNDLFEHSVNEPGVTTARWSTNVNDQICQICNPFSVKKSWLVTKMVNAKGYKLLHIDVDVFRRECSKCQNQDVKVSILKESLPGDETKSQEILNKLPVLTTLQNAKDDDWKVYHFQFELTSPKFSIVFLSEGSCTKIKRIKVFFFICEQNVTMGSSLPRTVAPASGFTKVNVSCSENALNPKNEPAYGLCSSKGMWNITSPCMCKKEFTLAVVKAECRECPVNTYKNRVGNGACNACPQNSRSDTGQNQCLCKDGFFRFIGDNIVHPCHGIPSKVRNIDFTDRTETSIRLFWEPPQTSGAPDQDVLYDVECKKCQSVSNDSKPCGTSCGTRVLFIPRSSNLTNTSVTVQNLDQDTEYEFVIHSKNLNSLRINSSKWRHSTKKLKTEVGTGPKFKSAVKTKSSFLTILLSVAVSVLVFLLITLCGILKYKRWYPCRKDAASELRQSEFVVEPSRNEESRYENPDELDIVLYEEIPYVVRLDENRSDMDEVDATHLHKEQVEHRSEYFNPDDNGIAPHEEGLIFTSSVLNEDGEKVTDDLQDKPSMNDLVYVIPLDDQTKPHEGLIAAPEKRDTRNVDSPESELIKDNDGYLLPTDGDANTKYSALDDNGTEPHKEALILTCSGLAADEKRSDGPREEPLINDLVYVIPLADQTKPQEGLISEKRTKNNDSLQFALLEDNEGYLLPVDGETDTSKNAHMSDPSAYARLNENARNRSDIENAANYQKLLKRHSDYEKPADGETDTDST